MEGHGEKHLHPRETVPTSSLLEVEASQGEAVWASRWNGRGEASKESYEDRDAWKKAGRKTKDEVEGYAGRTVPRRSSYRSPHFQNFQCYFYMLFWQLKHRFSNVSYQLENENFTREAS